MSIECVRAEDQRVRADRPALGAPGHRRLPASRGGREQGTRQLLGREGRHLDGRPHIVRTWASALLPIVLDVLDL